MDAGVDPVCDRILPHPDGGYVISGTVTRGGDYGTPLLMRVDDAGAVLWLNSYDSPATDDDGFVLNDMDIGPYGNIVLVGRQGSDRSDFTPVDNAFVLKVDEDGVPIWQRTFGGNHDGDTLADPAWRRAWRSWTAATSSSRDSGRTAAAPAACGWRG